jgi:hypothetical protein
MGSPLAEFLVIVVIVAMANPAVIDDATAMVSLNKVVCLPLLAIFLPASPASPHPPFPLSPPSLLSLPPTLVRPEWRLRWAYLRWI